MSSTRRAFRFDKNLSASATLIGCVQMTVIDYDSFLSWQLMCSEMESSSMMEDDEGLMIHRAED